MKEDDVVFILDGEEAGSWGVVRLVNGDGLHVAIANGDDAPRLYDRDQLRRPRDQEKVRYGLGLL